MPVYNEARTLRAIVQRVLESPVEAEIELICVDDGSSDDSLGILRELAREDARITVIAQPENMGKGRAIRTAIGAMTGDIAIVQDSDLEYDPVEYPKVIQPIIDGRADAVYGSRLANSEVRRVLFYWHSLGNRILTTISNMANDLNLTDMETCYKAVRADLLKRLRLTSDRFGFEPEITARLAHSGARIYEVPISYHGRTYAEGKNIGWRDGFEALWLIFKFRFLDTASTEDQGHLTLENLAMSPRTTAWMMEQFAPYLGNAVLDAGSGIGNLTSVLLNKERVHCIDLDTRHVETSMRKYGHLANLTVEQGDLEDPSAFLGLDASFDSVLCVNVLEHLATPEAALKNFREVLRSSGHILVLVPAHHWLYSETDRAIGHHQRYDRREVAGMLSEAGFELVRCYEFNRLGVLGWYANKLVGKPNVGRLQAKLFGLLIPIARLVERITVLPGLSVVAVGKREAGS